MDLAHRASEVAKKHYPDPEVTVISKRRPSLTIFMRHNHVLNYN